MTEPRMRVRQKGQQFSTLDLEGFLSAFGDQPQSLPATISLLDEIVTTFIIETCHSAALCATYSHRAKIKVDDFKFALRKDPKKLGRVTELLAADKDMKKKRKVFDVDDLGGAVGGERGKRRKGGEEDEGGSVVEKSEKARRKGKRKEREAS